LISKGFNVNDSAYPPLLPLHWYAESYRTENLEKKIKFLLSRGADPSLTDRRGKNAFEIAVEHNNQTVIKLLVAHSLKERRDSVE
jgi:ankyrin repeat protein